MAGSPFLLSKARPTPAQLADRLRPPLPDGLELYLDVADIRDDAAMAASIAAVAAYGLRSDDYTLLVEGPVGSLDGEFFDPTRGSEVDLEVVTRVARLAKELGAHAVNVHLISPSSDASRLTLAGRTRLLERAIPFLSAFVEQVTAAGAVPTIENMPPVLRMRQGGFFFTPIGMAAEDLAWVRDRVPGLAATIDMSHAALYVNARTAASGALSTASTELAEFPALQAFLHQLPTVSSVLKYAEALGGWPLTCHVANASGLLGEGDPYDRGDVDADPLFLALARRTTYFVTETLEPDPAHAVNMRYAIERMRLALGRPARVEEVAAETRRA